MDEAKETNNTRQKTERARKMTYAERKEFEHIENELPTLTAHKEELEIQLSSGTLSAEQIQAISLEYQSLIEQIDEMEMRWLELDMINSGN
jgi:ATP-binding cassette subfamily F protein uup